MIKWTGGTREVRTLFGRTDDPGRHGRFAAVDGRTSGDPVCRNLAVRREPLEEQILELVHKFAHSMLEERKSTKERSNHSNADINAAELSKQNRQLSSLKIKLYDDYKDGHIDRELYKRKTSEIAAQIEDNRRKIEEASKNKIVLEQDNEETDRKLEEMISLEKFDAENLRKVIKVIRVHSQEEIEIVWNFDDVFSDQG